MAGVGKSYLAERFALLHGDRFPGGVLRLVLEAGGAPPDAARLLERLADRLKLPPGAADLAERVRERLLRPASLLHVENVDTEPLAAAAAGLVAALPGCAVLITGRYRELGETVGWAQVTVQPFDETAALAQLEEELGPEAGRETPEARRQLVRTLGFLPLAIHLAAAYLRRGHSAAGFLTHLRSTGFALPNPNVAERALTREAARQAIASTFALSLDTLAADLAAQPEGDGERLLAGLLDLGAAPASGFGASLGAALAGLAADEFERLAVAAMRLSVLEAIPPKERRDRAHRLHPLLAELLRTRGGRERSEIVHAQLTKWFCSRLPDLPGGQAEEQGRRWREVHAENAALNAWLGEVRPGEGVVVERAGSWFAIRNGPFHVWLTFLERLLGEDLADGERSNVLWTLGHLARRAGDLDRAMRAAEEQLSLDQAPDSNRDHGRAVSLIADVLFARGELDEALRIHRDRQLPIYERSGDDYARAMTLGQIAEVLYARGEVDKALRIHREDELPVYERLGDVFARTVTLGKIANILQTQGELDEALRIRRKEQIPVYERFEDVRARAVTLGKIADILQTRGELDEALRIRREEQMPVYERFKHVRARAVTLGKIAQILEAQGEIDEAVRIRREEQLPVFERRGFALELVIGRFNLAITQRRRNLPGDREAAIALLRLALPEAERMRLPLAKRIRSQLGELEEGGGPGKPQQV